MSGTDVMTERLRPRPLLPDVWCVQPGGGWVAALERAWGRLRRWWLRTFRPMYVARLRGLRRGECPDCPHDVVDERDLKYYRNVCGYHFDPGDLPRRWCDIPPIAAAGRAALFVAWFFRDPPRATPAAPGAVVAPADGVITDVEELADCPYWDGPAVKVGIYLSLFDVHVNRAPETARVIEVRYARGRFLDSGGPRAAHENENCCTLFEVEAPPHPLLLVRQIAGAFARRIVCAARPGEVLARGERLGMIKFGSRTELYLTRLPGLSVTVRPGDRVRAGSSVVARYATRGIQSDVPASGSTVSLLLEDER